MALSVGLLGFGTVGQSVARLLVERTDGLLTLTHVFNRDVARKRVDWVPASVTWTDRIDDVLEGGVDVIVEADGDGDVRDVPAADHNIVGEVPGPLGLSLPLALRLGGQGGAALRAGLPASPRFGFGGAPLGLLLPFTFPAGLPLPPLGERRRVFSLDPQHRGLGA